MQQDKQLFNLNDTKSLSKKQIDYILNIIFNSIDIKLCDLKISCLKSLTYLNLSNSRFKYIPDINSFDKLIHLDLSNNNIYDISNIYKLTNLTHLDLSKNHIQTFEYEIHLLSSLKVLNLSSNEIDYINFWQIISFLLDKFIVFKNIINLDLSNNNIKLISNINILINLTKLNLSNNSLISLEPNFEPFNKLTKLKYLNISHTYIGYININISTLKYLNLSNSSVNKMPEYLNKLTKLKYLDISHNNLNKFNDLDVILKSEDIVKLTKLKFLNLSDTNLQIVTEDIIKLTKLRFLDLSKNLNLKDVNKLRYLSIKKLKL